MHFAQRVHWFNLSSIILRINKTRPLIMSTFLGMSDHALLPIHLPSLVCSPNLTDKEQKQWSVENAIVTNKLWNGSFILDCQRIRRIKRGRLHSAYVLVLCVSWKLHGLHISIIVFFFMSNHNHTTRIHKIKHHCCLPNISLHWYPFCLL